MMFGSSTMRNKNYIMKFWQEKESCLDSVLVFELPLISKQKKIQTWNGTLSRFFTSTRKSLYASFRLPRPPAF